MSFLDLNPDQERDQLDYMARNPSVAGPEPFFTAKSLLTPVTGFASGAAASGAFFGEALSPIMRSAAPAIDRTFGTNAASWVDDELRKTRQNAAKSTEADPYTYGTAGNIVHGLGKFFGEFVPASVVAGPVVGASVAAGSEGTVAFRQALAAGQDEQTAALTSGVSAAATGFGAFLPLTGKTYLQSFLRGAVLTPEMNAFQRGVTGEILDNAGYHDMAQQYQALDSRALATDAILGAAFGGVGHWLHPGNPMEAHPEAPMAPRIPTIVDAAQVDALARHRQSVAPGIPIDVETLNAHNEALTKATMDLLAGKPVDVVDVAPRMPEARPEASADLAPPVPEPHAENFIPDPHDEHAAVNKAFAELADDEAAQRAEGESLAPEAAPEPQGPSPIEFGETARKRFLREIRRHGGIDIAEAADITGERGFRAVAGAAGIFRRPAQNASGVGRALGHSMDRHVEWMVEHGYMTEAEVADDPAGGVDRARELVAQALGKEPVLTIDEQQQMTALQAQHEAAGFTEDDHAAAHLDAMPPPERLEYERWLAYADELEGTQNEIDAIRSSGQETVPGENRAPGTGGAEARPGVDRGSESLQALTRADDRGDQQGGGQVNEPQKDTYSGDLFGNALPDRGGADQRAGGDRRPEPSAPVRKPEEIAPGVFAASTAFVQTATVRVGTTSIKSAADAAHVFSYLRKFPQENVAILTVDANGKALALVRHSIGRRADAHLEMSTVVGSALRDPRAAEVWVAHNHPSGNPEFSGAKGDLGIHRNMASAFADSPVKYRGFFAIAKDRASFVDPNGRQSLDQEIRPMRRTEAISLQDRVYRQNGTLDKPIRSHADALSAAEKISKGEPGVILLDHQLAPVAWLPLSMEQMTRAGRLEHVQRHIWTGLESSNASAAIVTVKGGFDLGTIYAMRNLLQGKAGMRLIDVVNFHGEQARSARAAGVVKENEPLLTSYTNADALQREADAAAAAKQDANALAVQKAKAIADAQRDTFALTGSDRTADTAGQDSLFEPAAVYPGTVDEPMTREAAFAAADARVADAEANAEKATAMAVQCSQVEGST